MEDAVFEKVKNNLQCFNRPIYETIIDTLLAMIESGELPEGTKFPPDKKLAIELGISHITLAKALNELRRRGVLDRRRASGTSVPTASVQNLSQKIGKKIAVVFDAASEATFQQSLFLQLHRGLTALNCAMLFYSSDNDPVKQQRQIDEILQDITVSGCIVWSILDERQAREVMKNRPRCYPLIFLDKYYPDLEHDAVTYADFACAAAMARSVVHRKMQRVVWLQEAEKQSMTSVADRRAGFQSVWKERSPLTVYDVTEDDASFPAEFPDDCAVICADAQTAMRLSELSQTQNRILPPALYTFGTEMEQPSQIPDFTIYQFTNEIGNNAIQILASRLNGKESCTVNHSGKWSVLAAKRKKTGVKK